MTGSVQTRPGWTRLASLVRMRLAGFSRSGRLLAPVITLLIVLGILYGGGAAPAGEAYGFAALVLFPVLAWQTKLLLDAEPDVQRRLAVVAAGGLRRELTAGLLAAGVVALAAVAASLVLPWPLGGITGSREPGDTSLPTGIALGVWAHLIAIPPAIALGALASRAITRHAGRGVVVLAAGAVVAWVLGLRGSPVPWLAPPLLAAARAAAQGPAAETVLGLTGWALAWAAAGITLYVWLRRTRR